ncbi:hypothetical protein CYFUS_002236 [Cystobacter fuscus]|uniref:Uncharacterized protein n=1 Tax=Cystobacter fuscus TaxID=43 RepID=A0A250J088_9BACT|nr:hypothetical protein [Cystobacter fuscus]ATB36821.1 hypothetical protein CYFUS_002236 [Cystobacter fuscus]
MKFVFSSDMIVWFDIPNAELYNTVGWGNDRSNEDPPGEQIYFWSNRAAMFLCQGRGYKTGFFTGHQDRANGLTGLFCLANTNVQVVSVASNDTRFSFGGRTLPGVPIYWLWYESNIAANEVCGYHGYQTGILSDMSVTGQGFSWLGFRCWN